MPNLVPKVLFFTPQDEFRAKVRLSRFSGRRVHGELYGLLDALQGTKKWRTCTQSVMVGLPFYFCLTGGGFWVSMVLMCFFGSSIKGVTLRVKAEDHSLWLSPTLSEPRHPGFRKAVTATTSRIST